MFKLTKKELMDFVSSSLTGATVIVEQTRKSAVVDKGSALKLLNDATSDKEVFNKNCVAWAIQEIDYVDIDGVLWRKSSVISHLKNKNKRVFNDAQLVETAKKFLKATSVKVFKARRISELLNMIG